MISIIGAGPVGSYLAFLVAKSGKEVSLFEEHSQIGKPVQCTGLVTSDIENIIPMKEEFILNKIDTFKIFSPDGNFVELKLHKPNIVLDRAKFDLYLSKMAANAGVRIFTNYKFLSYEKPFLVFANRPKFKTDVLIGADGPLSRVAKVTNLYGKRKFVAALQARVSVNVDKYTAEVYLNQDYFAWLVPESRTIARMGIIAKKNHNKYFKDFLDKRAPNCKVREYQSGIIPMYNKKIKTQKGNIYLVGDAAMQVKATTYGGIIPGLVAAQELSKAILKRKNYQKLCRKKIGKELNLHLLIRKILNKFTNKDYNDLIRLAKNITPILEKYDREKPSKFLFKAIIKEPRLLKFGFKFL